MKEDSTNLSRQATMEASCALTTIALTTIGTPIPGQATLTRSQSQNGDAGRQMAGKVYRSVFENANDVLSHKRERAENNTNMQNLTTVVHRWWRAVRREGAELKARS